MVITFSRTVLADLNMKGRVITGAAASPALVLNSCGAERNLNTLQTIAEPVASQNNKLTVGRFNLFVESLGDAFGIECQLFQNPEVNFHSEPFPYTTNVRLTFSWNQQGGSLWPKPFKDARALVVFLEGTAGRANRGH